MDNPTNRGDGFDLPAQPGQNTTDISKIPDEQMKEIAQGIQNIGSSGISGVDLKNMSINQIMKLGRVSEQSAQIIKTANDFGSAGAVNSLFQQINERLGYILPEEYVGLIAGGIGGFLGGLVRKNLRGKPGGSRGNNRRRR